ncbi:putative Very-long-chain 3-oxoacyl-CoA reductase 1 [Blattamonas nauphoetae]|uniref:Very-long-chain 3-oxoacyl-CoA reductase 1 n=1 Tax=Blattamonas nauphoetae TaxID=2049346 RepID=A0ABQ9YL89_9EUKA|nr:putative Very-long-chain 3-oxoacyl-CoA reductase 1 [Blattamonas nauphoetae]
MNFLLSFFLNISAALFCLSIFSYLIPQLVVWFLPERNLKHRYGQSWCVVTGGSSGIGQQFAVKATKQGMNCVIIGRNESHLNETKDLLSQLNPQTQQLYITADFSKDPDVVTRHILQQVEELDISVLFLNAGYGSFEKATGPSSTLVDMLNTNTVTNLALFNSLSPRILRRSLSQTSSSKEHRGAVFLTSSVVDLVAVPYAANYCSTKSSLAAFGESLAFECQQVGVDVVVLRPGPVNTRFYDRISGISILQAIQLVGSSPQSVVRKLFKSVGRLVACDVGLSTILVRLFTKVVDYNAYATFVAPIFNLFPEFQHLGQESETR